MEYIDVLWKHENPNSPIRLVSELGEDRFEIRKLEFFVDGTLGFAWEYGSTQNTELGDVPVPTLEEINSNPKFQGVKITNTEFEILWQQRAKTSA
jgi:hypothetical protein